MTCVITQTHTNVDFPQRVSFGSFALGDQGDAEGGGDDVVPLGGSAAPPPPLAPGPGMWPWVAGSSGHSRRVAGWVLWVWVNSGFLKLATIQMKTALCKNSWFLKNFWTEGS